MTLSPLRVRYEALSVNACAVYRHADGWQSLVACEYVSIMVPCSDGRDLHGSEIDVGLLVYQADAAYVVEIAGLISTSHGNQQPYAAWVQWLVIAKPQVLRVHRADSTAHRFFVQDLTLCHAGSTVKVTLPSGFDRPHQQQVPLGPHVATAPEVLVHACYIVMVAASMITVC